MGGNIGQCRSQQAQQPDRQEGSAEECMPLPSLPEAAWIERDDAANYSTAPRQLKHDPASHRTACGVSADQVVRMHESGNRIRQAGD